MSTDSEHTDKYSPPVKLVYNPLANKERLWNIPGDEESQSGGDEDISHGVPIQFNTDLIQFNVNSPNPFAEGTIAYAQFENQKQQYQNQKMNKPQAARADKTENEPVKCGICNHAIHKPNSHKTFTANDGAGYYYCDTCDSKGLIHVCESCGNRHTTTHKNKDYCDRCIRNAPQSYIKSYGTKAENQLSRVQSLKQEAFLNEISREKFGQLHENNLGIEVELETPAGDNAAHNLGIALLRIRKLVSSFAIIKRDSTLINGFEITSAPADKDSHTGNSSQPSIWKEFFDAIENDDNFIAAPFDT